VCLTSRELRGFFADIFFSIVGLTIFKALVFTALVFALVLKHSPASFKSEVDCRTGGPNGLWLSDGI
jgi:hypothetical protein